MNRVQSVAIHEIVVSLKRRSYLLMSFGLPVLAILATLGYTLFHTESEPKDPFADLPDKPIGYVDHSDLFGAGPGTFAVFLVPYQDEEGARKAVEDGELSSYYLIPDDYLETGQVTRFSSQFNVIETDVELFASFLVASLLKGDSPLLLQRLQSPAVVIEHQLDRSGELLAEIEGDSFSNFGLVYAFALIMMLTTFFGATQLMRSVIIEKESRAIEIALSSLKPIQLLAGKVIGQGAAGLIQMLAWLGAVLLILGITGSDIPFIGQVDLPPDLFVAAVLYFLGGYLLFAAFASGLGAISTNMREGPQYAVVYTLPAVVPLMLMPNILEAPNGAMAVFLSFFPLCAPLGMIERLVVTTVPIWQIGLSLLGGAVSAYVMVLLAARFFPAGNLLSSEAFSWGRFATGWRK